MSLIYIQQNIINICLMEKQEIRINRDRLKKSLRIDIISSKPISTQESIEKSVQQPKIIQNRPRGRTHQENINSNYIEPVQQVYSSIKFSDMFFLGKKIGEGTQSVVYQCKQIETNKIYAVKSMRSNDIQTFRTLKEQYRILKTLDHQNIIKADYLFINSVQSTIHLVCQYFPFQTLQQHMEKHIIAENQAAVIIGKLLNTLNYIHKNNICHRDIKPQNILFNPKSKQIKIIDFQIARMSMYKNSNIKMLSNTGSLYYKAPEMFQGMIYDQAIDIWAVGVILYEMIVGKLPFYSQYEYDLIKSIKEVEPSYPPEKVKGYCLQFLTILLKKNPNERLSAKQMMKHPFMLKNAVTKSDKSLDDSSQSYQSEHRQKEVMEFPYHDDTQKINGKECLPNDIGIRYYGQS